MNKPIAIIPARAGSKRILDKNIKEFLGKPIIGYSIKAAIDSSLFSEVIVSTDSEEIKKISISYGAKVPFLRSKEKSNDSAHIAEVLMEVLSEYAKLGVKPEYICCIYATAPMVSSTDLKQSYQQLVSTEADGVIAVTEYSYPIERSLYIDKNGNVNLKYPAYKNVRSQDTEPSYHDAGQFFWLKVKSFAETHEIFSNNLLAYVLPNTCVQDIDTIQDWKIAELKYSLCKQQNS